MAKINGNEIKPGVVLEHDGGLWAAVKVSHVKPGKGGAFAQVEMKNLRDGRKLNERFRSEDKVDQVQLDNKDQQFLYESDGKLIFMDSETFEQTVAREVFEETRVRVIQAEYLCTQPWPFPGALMVGFRATAHGDVPQVDGELEDARWFAIDQLPPLPMQRSIARYLIDLYVARRLGHPEPQLPR